MATNITATGTAPVAGFARWAPLAGAVTGDMVRYLISVVITIGFGMILGFRVTTNPASAVAGCLLLLVVMLNFRIAHSRPGRAVIPARDAAPA